MQFFPTTGRDEFDPDKDQLYHDGIELDRANDWSKAQEIAMSHRSIFSPNYDETKIKKPKEIKSFAKTRKVKKASRKVKTKSLKKPDSSMQ